MNIQRWITHCDTIGDIFKNPILLQFIRAWYEIKNEGASLQIRKETQWGKNYTSEFYEFIRAIFEDRSDMEAFLDYVRERVLTSKKISQKLFWRFWDGEWRQYSNQDIIKALLAFDELNDQLSTVTKLTVSWVFQTRIVDIIRKAQDTDAHEEEDTDVYDDRPLYYALERILEDGVVPISLRGEIICKIADSEGWHIISVVWWNSTYEVDRLWNPTDRGNNIIEIKWEERLDTREKIVARIKLLERILRYHLSDNFEISEEEEKYYADLSNAYESKILAKNHEPMWDENYHGCTRYFQDMIAELTIKLKNTKPTDTTMIQALIDTGIKPGVGAQLPKIVDWKKTILSGKPTLKIVQ